MDQIKLQQALLYNHLIIIKEVLYQEKLQEPVHL